jgi:hypothetical protein
MTELTAWDDWARPIANAAGVRLGSSVREAAMGFVADTLRDHEKLRAENERLRAVLETFVARVDAGEVYSVKTYSAARAALAGEQP